MSACFEEQHAEIRRQRSEAKLGELESLLTAKRRDIFPLLFDSRHLSQVHIAEEANTTQPTVSRFIKELLECDLIGQTRDETGTTVYEDNLGLRKLMEASNEQE